MIKVVAFVDHWKKVTAHFAISVTLFWIANPIHDSGFYIIYYLAFVHSDLLYIVIEPGISFIKKVNKYITTKKKFQHPFSKTEISNT